MHRVHTFPILGVRELFEQEPLPVPKKSRAELMKDIDADYYGYRDDDDGILIPLEQEAEKEGNLKLTSSVLHIYLPDAFISFLSCG